MRLYRFPQLFQHHIGRSLGLHFDRNPQIQTKMLSNLGSLSKQTSRISLLGGQFFPYAAASFDSFVKIVAVPLSRESVFSQSRVSTTR